MFSRLFASFAAALMAGVMLVAAGPLHAQSPAPYPKPDLDIRLAGEAYASVLMADGSIVIGGVFSQVNGIPRNNIVRMLPNGQMDMTWDPDIGGAVYALAVDSSGRVYVGGSFSSVGGESRKNLVRLFGVGPGVADATWLPEPDAAVHALLVSDSDTPTIIAGGRFLNIGGASRQRLAMLSPQNGQALASWNVPVNGDVHALAFGVQQGFLHVGGRFTTIGGIARNRLARLFTATGEVVANWDAQIDTSGMYPESAPGVYALALQGGYLVVGGSFRKVAGLNRSGLARIYANSTFMSVDANWAPNLNYGGVDADVRVNAVAVSSAGTVYVGGQFSHAGFYPDRLERNGLVRIPAGSSTGAVDPDWNPQLDRQTRTLQVAPGTEIVYAGGAFRHALALDRVGWVALASNGAALSRTANLAGDNGLVWSMARQPDGGLIVGGNFHMVDGNQVRQYILRVRPDGTLDPDWRPRFNDTVRTIAIDGDGRIYVGGSFSSINGQYRYRLAKLWPNGSPDASWVPRPVDSNASIQALALTPDGKIYVGGSFSGIRHGSDAPVSRSNLARLFTSDEGAVDSTWNVPVTQSTGAASVRSLQLSPDGGALYIGGRFDSVGGLLRGNIAKLSYGGWIDHDWALPTDGIVEVLHYGADGWLYVGGSFTQVGGYPHHRLARVSPTGNGLADAAWNPSPNETPLDIVIGADAAYVCGFFTQIGGQTRMGLAKVSLTGSGQVDPAWNPVAGDGYCLAAVPDGSNGVYAGGIFEGIGSQPWRALVRLPGMGSDLIFANGFET